MGSYLWEATANKNFGRFLKGIMVEVLMVNRSGKLSVKEIHDLLERKYFIKVGNCMRKNTFNIING